MAGKRILKLGVIVFTLFFAVFVVGKMEDHTSLNHELKANSGYKKGDKVYIGNELYTVIDPSVMTLLADNATDAGEVTWDEANASLSSLPNQYGMLGSKVLKGKFSLPTSENLASITNTSTSTLDTVPSIPSDWWLGDPSIDNRSKFVGANTNSLITDVEMMKNYIDNNYSCLKDQTVTEQGIKPTITAPDADEIKNKVILEGELNTKVEYRNSNLSVTTYTGSNCKNQLTSGVNKGSNSVVSTFDDYMVNASSKNGVNAMVVAMALNQGFDATKPDNVIQMPYIKGECINLEPYYVKDSVNWGGYTYYYKSLKFEGTDGWARVTVNTPANASTTETIECEGRMQTAGISTVRPLLSLSNSTIVYTSNSKPMYKISSTLNGGIPKNQGDSYITVKDDDLIISLDQNNENVDDLTLSASRSTDNIISIPVMLGGETDGTRYVSAQATTTNGEAYGVLGIVNGTTGTVDVDVSNFPNYKTANNLTLTLFQEVDEGTNTTYIGEGKEIKINFAPAITDITFTPSYPDGKAGWNYGDTGINASGEQTGSFSFTGGTSGIMDETTNKDYQKWELVDANGNVVTDSNFTIVDNKLQAKGKVPIGSHTLRVMVTDLNGQTFTKEITIDIAKASNPFGWVDAVKNTTYIYYGDTLALDVIGVEENATVTYGPSTYVSGNTLTGGKPIAKLEITASTQDTSSYGATSIKQEIEIKKRPVSVKVEQKDNTGIWQDTVTIKQGQTLPDTQVVEDTGDSTSKGLASSESSFTDPKLGTLTYEYRKENNVVSDPSSEAGTYNVYAIYTDSEYYSVSVSAGILIVEEPDTIDDANKQQFYEFKLADGSTPDITKWQKEDIIIHPKHATYTQMKVDNGSYQTGDQTYTSEGSNTVALSFKDASGATTSTITETLKIDKTNPTIDKVEFSENDTVQSAGNGSFQYLFKNIADIVITASDAQSGIAKYTVKVTKLKADGSIDTTQTPVVNDIPSTATTLATSITQQGMYQVEISVSDASGRSSTISTATIKIKSTQTTMEVKGYLNSDSTKPYDGKTWTNQPILLKLNASDQTALTNLQMSTDGTNFTAMSKIEYLLPNTASIDGTTYYFKAVNIDGDEVSTSMKIYMDVDAPATPTIIWQDKKQNPLQELISLLSFDSLFSKEVQASFTANDAPSGIDTYSYTITELDKDGNDIGTPMTGKGSTYDLKKNKNYRVEVIAYDKAGNASSPAIKTAQIDTEAPVIEGVKDKSEYKQYYLPRFISVKDMPINGSGLKTATYTRDTETAVNISDTVKLMDTGSYVIEAEDYAGNKVRLTFKIVPLPSLDDIDGTDESKAIIDQIQKELDEIKDKIDGTEEKNYTEWIEDATEEWESLRKKVVEDEETTSKVEGEGDTTFDPKVELIVDPILEEKLPKLPRKALFAYDVYLMKNNTVVQPDGSVKVYLPYNEEEPPIVYQIDEKGAVKEIKATKENGYVTFTTDTLLQYAISNTAQELTDPVDDKTCVVGPDGIAGTKDDICGEGNGDKEPEKKPDGSVEVPDGGTIVFPNGNEIDTPNGGIIKPDGSVELPDGTQYDPEGNIIPEDTTKPKECKLNGKAINIDSDKDGLPDLNLDIRNANGDQEPDCIADLNLDVDNDGIADIDIDTDGDGQADINLDVDKDGQADINIAKVSLWKPDKNDCVYMGFRYDTMADIKPYLNVDEDGDGEPDRNIDDDGDGIPDRNIDADWFEKYGNPTTVKANYKESEGTGGVLTGDHTRWLLWWIMLVITGGTMAVHLWKKHHNIRQH